MATSSLGKAINFFIRIGSRIQLHVNYLVSGY
jgi:hypothetical protein